MRREQHQQLLSEEIAAIPADPRWELGELRDGAFLHFRLKCSKDGKWYSFRLGLYDYDLQPPTLRLVNPESGKPDDRRSAWPPPPFTNGQDHPHLKRPWCCMIGLAEFHSHPLDKHRTWDAERNFKDLAGIISNLATFINEKTP